MATNYNKTISLWWIFMVLSILDLIRQSCVEGLQTFDKANLGPKPKGTIKTIKVPEDGDVIDCVDIYKQPAFDNPFIKELKMVPSSLLNALNKTSYPRQKLIQTWNKYGECPKGTIPIRRTWNNNGTIHRKIYDNPINREYATVVHYHAKKKLGHGGRALFNVWKPQVEGKKEFSLSQLWVAAGPDSQLNTIEAGLMVYPDLFHDSLTRLFIYWTNDTYRSSGCYNLLCTGFVQTNLVITLGGEMEHVSVYGGEPVALHIGFTKSQDTEGGDWWLQVGEYILGYYPRSLFPSLGDGADHVAFGGEIINDQSRLRHTKTEMGSGHYSAQRLRRACFISKIQVANEFTWVEPNLEIQDVTRPTCYDLTFGPPHTQMGSHFYFGGPGFSHVCP